jgi:hypothetical protein
VPPATSEPAREEPAGQETARKEPARKEPARSADADARALVTAKGLHISSAASMLNVVSASDSSLGSAGTMEHDRHQADTCEVTSREGHRGVAPKELFFSGLRASVKTQAAEVEARLARLEKADKVSLCMLFSVILVLSW